MGELATPPRTEVVFDHRMFGDSDPESKHYSAGAILREKLGTPTVSQGAMRMGDWKIIVGREPKNNHYGWFSPNVSRAPRYIDVDDDDDDDDGRATADMCSDPVSGDAAYDCADTHHAAGCSSAVWDRHPRAPTVATAAECCSKCLNTTGCGGWTWNGPSGNLGCSGYAAINGTTKCRHCMTGSAIRPIPRPPPPPAPTPPGQLRACQSEAECFGGPGSSGCSAMMPCLFNVVLDPSESSDQAEHNPSKLAELLKRFREFDATFHPPWPLPKGGHGPCLVQEQGVKWVLPCPNGTHT